MDAEDLLYLMPPGQFISGEALSALMGISRAAVWKKIEALRDAGFDIESGGRRGYRLNPGDGLHPALWQPRLETEALGRGTVLYQETLDSTNAQLRRLAAEGAPHGSLCLCEQQTAGRGRLGRSWHSPAGAGLWQSVLLRPALSPVQAQLLTLCAALAMTRAVTALTGLPVGVKWPNDLLLHGKKICGILLELSTEMDAIGHVIVGVGLNVHPRAVPEALRGQAAALGDEVTPPPRRDILLRYLAELEVLVEQVTAKGYPGIAAEYEASCLTLGRPVRVTGGTDMSGTAEAVDEDGALLVRTEDGALRRVLAGDVSVRGLMGYV